MSYDPADFPDDLEYSPANARALRLGAEMTLPEAAAATNIKKVTWVAYEKGKIRMPAERWIAFKQCIKTGAYKAFLTTPQRRGPFVRSAFEPGEHTKDRETPVVNGGSLLQEGREALSLTAGQLAQAIGLGQANAVYTRERGVISVLPHLLSGVLDLLRERLQSLAKADLTISTKEDLGHAIEMLRVTHAELGKGAPVGMQEARKAVFHLIGGRKALTQEIAGPLTANAEGIRLRQLQALMTAIARIEAVFSKG